MKKITYLLVVTTLVLFNCSNDDMNSSTVTDAASLTKELKQIFEASNFPGFTIGIVKNGVAEYQENFGLQNIENNISYSNQTIQPIASVSKTFIGVAAVKAIELGYFDLETPINDILNTDLINPKNPNGTIRIKHLVNHTSGLIDDDDNYVSSYYILNGQDLSTDGAQLMQDFGISQKTPKSLSQLIEAYYYPNGGYYSQDNFEDSTPGEIEEYSNMAASLMAYLIELSATMSYQDFLQVNIFDPLEMNHTTFEHDITNPNYAVLYFDEATPLPYYGLESFPDGGLKTSNEDMMKYMLHMIAGQRGETNTLFNKSFYNLLFTETSSNYTIFWDVDPGNNAFGHRGGDPGLSSEFHFSGPGNAGFYILTNYDQSTDEHEAHYDEIIVAINESINMFFSN